jgi:heme/copper-type cytochrome/quinol oxidase subunit 2
MISKKILLLILFLLFSTTGAMCSPAQNVEPVVVDEAVSSDDEEDVVVEEPDLLEGEIREDEEVVSGPVTGEVDFDQFVDTTDFDTRQTDSFQEGDSVDKPRVFSLIAKNFEFVPNIIRVKQGNKVIINITSEDEEHSFVISEYGIKKAIPVGENTIIEFTADKVGTFRFYSDIYSGVGSSNMRGSLVVSQ